MADRMMIPLDKQAHAWAGCAIFGLAVAVLPPLYALLLVAGAAIGKELWDRRTHPADWLDAAATIAGGLVAAAWNYGVQLV
jgi:hypothetical protein